MPSREPDQRYLNTREAVRNGAPPVDGRERALYHCIRREPADATIQYAYDIHRSEYQRELLQAWFVAGATDTDVETLLRVPCAVTEAYRRLFFDMEAFRDHLVLLSWVHDYKGSAFGRTILQQAVMSGIKGMMWQFSLGDASIDPKVVLGQVMVDSYYRARAGRTAGLSSAESNAAHQHMKTAMTAATTLSKTDTGNALGDLLIKLQHRDLTAPSTDVPDTDLLH